MLLTTLIVNLNLSTNMPPLLPPYVLLRDLRTLPAQCTHNSPISRYSTNELLELIKRQEISIKLTQVSCNLNSLFLRRAIDIERTNIPLLNEYRRLNMYTVFP